MVVAAPAFLFALLMVNFVMSDARSMLSVADGAAQKAPSTQEHTAEYYESAHRSAVAEAEKYAYLDIEAVSPELRQKIIDSRDIIIFSTDWVSDEAVFGIRWDSDGVIHELPKFSEVFPGWDNP